jgi:hypothetical protein
MEIIYDDEGPCLVEVGARCDGGEGAWLVITDECIGYSQVMRGRGAYRQSRM